VQQKPVDRGVRDIRGAVDVAQGRFDVLNGSAKVGYFDRLLTVFLALFVFLPAGFLTFFTTAWLPLVRPFLDPEKIASQPLAKRLVDPVCSIVIVNALLKATL
jgi:hypothetical protein